MSETLGQPAWMTAPATAAVLDALETAGGADCARFVGGCVRNALIGKPIDDIDIATRLSPQAVIEALKAAGLKAVPTGVEHGTVTAVSGGKGFEVTTLRRDVATDGRRAVVAFTDDWAEDARRRDFTLNSLYAQRDGSIYDPTGHGVADARAGRVVFVGDADQRIAEDHLRILRFFRFQARFGSGAPDAAGLAACTARANDLMALSRERVRGELLRLLAVRDPVPTIAVMLQHRILVSVLPEITSFDGLARLVAVEAALAARATAPNPWLDREAIALRRLAALLPSDPHLLDAVATRLRLSNLERARLVATAASASAPLLAQAYRDGVATAADRLLLAARAPPDAALLAALDQLRRWQRPALPLSGKDIIARGTAPGPEVSRRLASFEAAWIGAGFPADPATVERLLAS